MSQKGGRMIESILREKLPLISVEETLADLGNRGDYVGASDISSCPRKVVMSKLFKKEHDLEQLIVFQRGHLAENIIKKALLKWKEEMPDKRGVVTQYEVKALNGKVRAHLDFLIKDETRKLTVIEVKSANMVEQPYEAWLNQCNFQIGLLKQSPKTTGLPISGEVLAIDLKKGAVKEFPVEFSPEIFTAQMGKAEYLIKKIESAKNSGIEDINTEPSALCGFCDHRHDCPSYNKSDEIPEDLKGLLKQYAQVNALSKDIENNLSLLKDEITCYGKPFKASFDGIRASFTMSSYEALDIKRLKEELPEVAAEYSYPRASSRLIVNY